MNTFVLLCLLLIGAFAQKELSLPVEPETQKKLSLSIKNLVDELQTFRTPKQNTLALYGKVIQAYQVIQQIRKQLGHSQNVVVGKGNIVRGTKNILVGNYDSILGSNNFVLVDGYDGSVSGALLVEKWKIILDKKQWIKTNPSYAIFMINQQENRKYQRYLTRNRGFNYGSNLNRNSVLLIEEAQDEIKNEVAAGVAALQPSLKNLIESNGLSKFLPPGYQSPLALVSEGPKPQPYQPEQARQVVQQARPSQSYQTEQTRQVVQQTKPVPSYQPEQVKQVVTQTNQQISISQPSQPISYEKTPNNNLIESQPAKAPQSISTQSSSIQVQSQPTPQAIKVINEQTYPNQAAEPTKIEQPSLMEQNTLILNEKPEQQQQNPEQETKSSMNINSSSESQLYNVRNAQVRSNLSPRYVRSVQTLSSQNSQLIKPKYPEALPTLGNQNFPNLGPSFAHFKR